jgi:hypothetical protein
VSLTILGTAFQPNRRGYSGRVKPGHKKAVSAMTKIKELKVFNPLRLTAGVGRSGSKMWIWLVFGDTRPANSDLRSAWLS